ncbi:MAG: GTPase Era [Eubacteriaceae bacterium]|nr:GTPase Era [Eubacteriaceae bacterium]
MDNFKSGFIAVAGRTNVGKSTILNALVGQKLSIVSDKPQTTRNIIRMIRTTESSQMIFLDAPGFHKPRTRLGEYMDEAALSSLNDVDLILFVVEEDIAIGPGDRHILQTLEGSSAPVILVINKIDKGPRENVLKKIELYKDYEFIREIVPVSANKNINLDTLIEVIEKYLPLGPRYFPEDMVTDRAERFTVSELIREKMLICLKEEVPHGTAVSIEKMTQRGNIYDIEAVIYCEKKSHKGIIIGRGGEMLKRIATLARRDLEYLLDMKVNLNVWVKLREDWTDNLSDLKNLGYSGENEE